MATVPPLVELRKVWKTFDRKPVLRGIAPRSPEVLTPAQARERYGVAPPVEAHLEWRAKQHDRVFGAGEAPSDAGLKESEPILGSLVSRRERS